MARRWKAANPTICGTANYMQHIQSLAYNQQEHVSDYTLIALHLKQSGVKRLNYVGDDHRIWTANIFLFHVKS
jgi:hypothetical protein